MAGALVLAACQSGPEQTLPITIARDAFAGEALIAARSKFAADAS